MTPLEVRRLLDELDRRLGAEVAGFWRAAAASMSGEQFRAAVTAAFPQIVTPYFEAAAEIGAVFYEAQPSTAAAASRFTATPAPAPPAERFAESAQWALATGHGDTAIALLQGAATRALFDGLRDTVLDNAAVEPGTRWARYASATACGFCRVLATRTKDNLYWSEESATRVTGRSTELTLGDRRAIHGGSLTRERLWRTVNGTSPSGEAKKAGARVGDVKKRALRGNQSYGDRFHDNCRCTAVPVRFGGSYEPPEYVEQWEKDYYAAIDEAREQGLTIPSMIRGVPYDLGRVDMKTIARLMDPHRN